MDKTPGKHRRNDALLIGILTMLGAAWFITGALLPKAANTIEISVGNQTAATFAFGEERRWDWSDGAQHLSLVSDEEGVRILSSSCPDQLCVRQGTIRQGGQTLVCLPNRIAVRIGSEHPSGGMDAVLY